jgi:hypothetical protein
MDKDKLGLLAGFLRQNKRNIHKINLIEAMNEQIGKFSDEEKTPAEQIKGMNRLVRWVNRLDEKLFEEQNG